MKKLFLALLAPLALAACSDDGNDDKPTPFEVEITDLAHAPQAPTANDAVTVSATVTTDEGSILTSVKLEYAPAPTKANVSPAAATSVNMSKSGGNVYSANIPAQVAGVTIHYRVVAENNSNDRKEVGTV